MDRHPALPEYCPECTKAEDKVKAYSGSMEDNRKKKKVIKVYMDRTQASRQCMDEQG